MSIVAIEYVLRCRKDYYKVLKIEPNATVDEIKRQYKKTSLLCHPDKVDAEHRPKANEAFQVVSSAHSTLSDPQKRAVYDRHGVEGVKQHESGGGGGGGMRNPNHRPQFQHPFEEFLFNFHRPPPRRPGHDNHHQQHPQQQFQEINLNIFMVAPILLFILLAMLLQSTVSDSGSLGGSSFGGSGQKSSKNNLVSAFSLIPNYEGQMTVKRTTAHPQFRDFAVPYYVSRQWNDYAARGYIDVRKTEIEVLKKHRDSLGRRCESEALRNRGKAAGRASHDIPEVCKDYDNIRERVRG